MADPLLSGLRDAVATAITAANLDGRIDAPTGRIVPRYSKSDFLNKIACDALARPLSGEALTRGSEEYKTTIDVVVQYSFDEESEVDEMMLLCESIFKLFLNQSLEYPGHEANGVGVQFEAYDIDKARDKHFGTVISLEFEVYDA